MPTLTVMRNGVKANPKRRKRRNVATKKNPVTSASANPRKRRYRRNPATATVSASAANPRRKIRRRRRNPATASANPRRRMRYSKRRNGIFGNSKAEAKQVLSILGGLVGTKIAGGIITPYTASVLGYVGLGKFAAPITDAAIAVFATAPLAGAISGNEAKRLARLGGLAVAGLDLLALILPSGLGYSPFSQNTAPIVLASGGITPDDAKMVTQQAIEEIAGGQSPSSVASKVGMIFDTMSAQSYAVGNSPSETYSSPMGVY